MAVSGHNSINETRIGMSNSPSLSFFDEDMNEIKASQSALPIDIQIQRDAKALDYPFQYVNVSSIQFLPNLNFLQNSLKIKMKNVSLHIELKPLNESLGYLLIMKLGYIPILNSAKPDFTTYKIFCPCKYNQLNE